MPGLVVKNKTKKKKVFHNTQHLLVYFDSKLKFTQSRFTNFTFFIVLKPYMYNITRRWMNQLSNESYSSRILGSSGRNQILVYRTIWHDEIVGMWKIVLLLRRWKSFCADMSSWWSVTFFWLPNCDLSCWKLDHFSCLSVYLSNWTGQQRRWMAFRNKGIAGDHQKCVSSNEDIRKKKENYLFFSGL